MTQTDFERTARIGSGGDGNDLTEFTVDPFVFGRCLEGEFFTDSAVGIEIFFKISLLCEDLSGVFGSGNDHFAVDIQ